MLKTLLDLYTSTIRSWEPPKCPEGFKNSQEIRKYEEDFKENYSQHMKTIEGTVVRERDQQDQNNIGIIDKATLFSIHYESVPKHKDGTNWVCGTCPSMTTSLKNIEVLHTLTDEQQDREKLILERIKKRNSRNTL